MQSEAQCSSWGRFGASDELGTLNLIDETVVRSAMTEVITGKRFSLSLPLDRPRLSVLSPSRRPPVQRPSERPDGRQNLNFALSTIDPRYTDLSNDDYFVLYPQYSTHWDALCHVGSLADALTGGREEGVYYNGYTASQTIDAGAFDAPLARKLGIERMASFGIQTRGILVDLVTAFGRGRTVVDGEMLLAALDRQKIVPRRGDILCLYTGFSERLLDADKPPTAEELRDVGAALLGRDARLQQWIADTGLSAIASDNYAVEEVPNSEPGAERFAALPLHEFCLVKLGLPLAELWYYAELAVWLKENNRSSFLLTAAPIWLTGGFGAPVNPIATV